MAHWDWDNPAGVFFADSLVATVHHARCFEEQEKSSREYSLPPRI